MSISLAVLNKDNRVDRDQIAFWLFTCGRGRLKAVLAGESAAFVGLQRCKFEITRLVVINYEIHRGVAKITYPVKQNHRAHIYLNLNLFSSLGCHSDPYALSSETFGLFFRNN